MIPRWAAALLLLAAACGGKKAPPRDDDPRAVTVLDASAVIKTGTVGAEKPETATYVLVDVENPSRVDRLVTLEGQLLDASGKPVARLPPVDELRVPASQKRTFALVSDQGATPTASRATFRVANALAVDYPHQVSLADEKYTPGPVPVATASVHNTLDRDVTAVVAATFYDPSQAILSRPFTIVPLPIGATRQVRFEGPPTATKATVFVGQVAFH